MNAAEVDSLTEDLAAYLLGRGRLKGWEPVTAYRGGPVIAQRVRFVRRETLSLSQVPGGWLVRIETRGDGSPVCAAEVAISHQRVALDGAEEMAKYAIMWLP